jgi:hypothetical protein
MGTCRDCGAEVSGRSKRCEPCKRKRRGRMRREREEVMRSCGLVKVRGARGGIYWE